MPTRRPGALERALPEAQLEFTPPGRRSQLGDGSTRHGSDSWCVEG